MKIVLVLLTFVCVGIQLNAQQLTFPDDYLGVYKGDLVITSARGSQTIPMEFHLQATDTSAIYTYKLVYNADNPVVKDYTLKVLDRAKGQFEVDENNGIYLKANYFGNTLYSVFEVNESLLITTERFFEDKMEFEINFMSKKQATTSGNTDAVPEVISYPITTNQKALLVKQ